MKQLNYQQEAISELIEKSIRLLKLPGHRKQLVFKAPTGSGKTVMASEFLGELVSELHARADCPHREAAFIWIAPNKLHQQSYFKMKDFFTDTHLLRPVMYDELDHSDGWLKSGEILFVNWESINKANGIIVRDTEQGVSLFELARRTQEEHNLPLVVIIDEEHLFWSRTADKSAKVLHALQPKLEIRISATPKTSSDYRVTVPREAVVEEEMIKKQVVLNPDLQDGYTDERELNQHLLSRAVAKREQLAAAYRQLGININPLLLIQLPNDTSEAMTADDTAIAEQVKAHLSGVCGISEENGRLAVWLSKEKCNLEGIEDFDSPVEALLFKQAIALGWDCPRAAVLLIFRKMQSDTFTIQTVGRILRMPQQQFYTIETLNVGYVYTDISRDRIQIVAEDMDYLNKGVLQAVRRDGLHNVELKSYYSVYKSSDRNRLGPDFKQVLIDCFRRNWFVNTPLQIFTLQELDGDGGGNGEPTPDPKAPESQTAINRQKVAGLIRLDVRNVNVEIPSNLVFQNEEGFIDVGERHKFARSAGEVSRIYTDYCRSLLTKFEKAHSTGVLAGYLMQAMEELFELFETEARKVVLYHLNKPKFTDIIQKALDLYLRKLQKRQRETKQRSFEDYTWEVPAERLYKEETHQVYLRVTDHALLPFIELKEASTPEQRFRDFLETHAASIDWWYKNGDEGKQHYSIPYTTSGGEESLFYIDFIIRMKNGLVMLFDTKSEMSDPEAPAKHNALLKYIREPERADQHLCGGVIIERNGVWYYPPHPIDTTADTTGWEPFFPEQENKKTLKT